MNRTRRIIVRRCRRVILIRKPPSHCSSFGRKTSTARIQLSCRLANASNRSTAKQSKSAWVTNRFPTMCWLWQPDRPTAARRSRVSTIQMCSPCKPPPKPMSFASGLAATAASSWSEQDSSDLKLPPHYGNWTLRSLCSSEPNASFHASHPLKFLGFSISYIANKAWTCTPA
ncbi:UNVERIFIED_CONTAM: hypothetical protein GTU68_049925 [Idotea baltica]|nr:hypothetical protein [Idotea baltica]